MKSKPTTTRVKNVVRMFVDQNCYMVGYNDKNKDSRRVKVVIHSDLNKQKLREYFVEINTLLVNEFGDQFIVCHVDRRGSLCVKLKL